MNLQPLFRASLAPLCLSVLILVLSGVETANAQAATDATVTKLEEALTSIDEEDSAARQRLAVRRVIRDTEKAIEVSGDKPERWHLLGLRFRAQQQLIKLDDDPKHRAAMLETCRELMNAPNEFATLRLMPDLLLSQVEQAKAGASPTERAAALRPFVTRYVDTSAGPEAIKMAVRMAAEFGDSGLIADMRKIMQRRYAADHEMISYQSEQFKGQVFGAPFAGTLKRSDGKIMRFPMDAFGTASLVLFWSKEGEGMQQIQLLAEASKKVETEMKGRLNVFSCNLDDLGDAGESIVRGLGVDWPCLHLPGGRNHTFFKTYGGADPFLLRLSATGQAAVGMGGVRRNKEDGSPNYESTLSSYMHRPWTDLDYSSQLRAMSAGEFLILNPIKANPDLSPELKAIQACFVAPPMRHQLPHAEQIANGRKAVELCRKVIARDPSSSDLWLVRNHLIVALMGLWKSEGDLAHLEAAFVEAGAAMGAGYPQGTDLVARFCLARQALRSPEADTGEIIDKFITESKTSGPSLAAACLLALDVGDRVRFEQTQSAILKEHTEDPSMWLATSFLLDRHHHYWMFQVPYTFGWIYHLREGNSITDGEPEPANRMLKTELKTADGKSFHIPEDLSADYTMVLLAASPPWSSKRDDGLPTSPAQSVQDASPFIESRPGKDVQLVLAVLGDEPYDGKFVDRAKKELPCTMLALPDGLNNPVIHRLGMPALTKGVTGVLLNKEGRILIVSSSLSPNSTRVGNTIGNVVRRGVARQDALKVQAMIEEGHAAAAKEFILSVAPHLDFDAVDEKGRKIKHPKPLLSHLRARAWVYQALEDWEKALADGELVTQLRSKMDADMSFRSEQLGKDEAYRDEMKANAKE